jgi:hypothetical protein
VLFHDLVLPSLVGAHMHADVCYWAVPRFRFLVEAVTPAAD